MVSNIFTNTYITFSIHSEYGEEFVDLTDLQNELGLNNPGPSKMNL